MNDENSTFHVEIAGPVADIHKLSSWVVVLLFFFFFPFSLLQLSIQCSQCTIGPLEVCLIYLLPLKKYWVEDHKQRVSYSTSVQSWRVEFQEDLHWENP